MSTISERQQGSAASTEKISLSMRLRRAISRRWDVAVVLALAIILWLPRLSGPIDLRYDAGVYYLLGTSLASGHGYRIPSEPGSPHALQYPPLLPAIVASYERALGTSDPMVVAPWLRRSYAVLFVGYALAALTLAKRFVGRGLAVACVVLCLLHHQTIFLYDLLFAELPFAVVAVAFALLVGNIRESSRPWLREIGSFALATIGFLLRTAGLALLVAWVLEALTKRRWGVALARAAVALIPVIGWQAYVSHVRGSDEYAHPSYEYQRASYQYYNVSYAENALLVDPFRPELGHVTMGTLASRLATNSAQLLEAFGETVSTSRAQWKMLLNRPQHKLFHRKVIPPAVVFVPIIGLAAFIIGGFFVLVRRKAWLMVFLILGSVALVWTTPWPAQFLRYLAPLMIFLDLCFILALSGLSSSLTAGRLGRASALGQAILLGVLIVAFGTETFTALRLFHIRQLPEAIVFDPGKGHPYRLFAHDQAWRAWEKAVYWIGTNAPHDAIVATTAPHFCYLLTGLKAVLPPMESDASQAGRLLATVPVSYVIIDKLEFLDVSRRYARPAVEGAPAEWRLAHSLEGTKTYERIPGPQVLAP
jgi:hypothetical protein